MMLYNASFSELFIGALVILGWQRWLRPRFAPARFVPPVLLTTLGVAILAGAFAIQIGDTEQLATVQRAAFGVELVLLVLLGAWTALALGRGGSDAETTPSDDAS